MYTIGYLVYGFDLTGGGDREFLTALRDAVGRKPEEFGVDFENQEDRKHLLSDDGTNELLETLQEAGMFWTTYHGSSRDAVLAFGVKVDHFNATTNLRFDLLEQKAKITPKVYEAWTKLVASYPTLSEEIGKRLGLAPKMHIIWGTS